MHRQRDARVQAAVLTGTALVGLLIATRPTTVTLSREALRALGIFAWAVLNWVAGVLDDYVVGLVMAVTFVLSGAVPFSSAFGVFSGSTWWMVLGAVGLGAAVQRSGLLARLSLRTLLALPNTFVGQCLGLTLSGMLLGPALASVTGKAAIASRFVLGMHDVLELPDRSKHSTGLFMSMYLGFVLSAPLYMTASVCGFIVLGLIPPELKSGVTWSSWVVASLPLVGSMMVTSFVAIIKAFNPRDAFSTTRASLERQLVAMGKPGRDEVLTGVVLVATLIAWVTEPLHHVDTAIPAILGLMVLVWQRVLDRKAFDALPWSTLIFLGVVLNLGSVFPRLRIDAWAAQALGPALTPVANNPTVFLVVLSMLTIALRFVVVSYNALTSILMVSLLPLAQIVGIHPVILGQVLHVVGQATFFLPYHNPIYAIAYNGSEGRMGTHSQAGLISAASLAGCLIGVVLGSLTWARMGLIRR